jgi:hypothetical protein
MRRGRVIPTVPACALAGCPPFEGRSTIRQAVSETCSGREKRRRQGNGLGRNT